MVAHGVNGPAVNLVARLGGRTAISLDGGRRPSIGTAKRAGAEVRLRCERTTRTLPSRDGKVEPCAGSLLEGRGGRRGGG